FYLKEFCPKLGGYYVVYPLLHHVTENTVDHVETIPAVGNIIGALTPTLINFAIGIVAGAIVLLVVSLIQKMWPKASS
ncbi:hypothetical protein OPU36_17930, partial [Acinetobacter baumannii]|nr:hypothetical protein [Acinetobacter baumannii]